MIVMHYFAVPVVIYFYVSKSKFDKRFFCYAL